LEPVLDAIQAIAIVVTLWATGIGLGLVVRLPDITDSLKRYGLVARTITLDVLLVPIAMWITVRALVPDEGYATGLLLVAFAAAGPLGIKLAEVARADLAYAIGIVVVLEIANVVLIPLWSGILGLTSSLAVIVDMVRTVTLLVVLPITVGMLIRPRLAGRARGASERALRFATFGLLVVIVLIVGRSLEVVADGLTNGSATASVIVIAFALVAGWLLGWPTRGTRMTTSLVTGTRANGAALAVAVASFPETPEVAAGVVTAGLVSVTTPTAMAYLIAWRAKANLPEAAAGS
jgi:BASS family bile acid:Na+ symporter